MVRHQADKQYMIIFKAFKKIYLYYLKRGFQIITLHVDEKFESLQELIQEISRGFSLEQERQIQVADKNIRYIIQFLTFNKVYKLFMIHVVFQ